MNLKSYIATLFLLLGASVTKAQDNPSYIDGGAISSKKTVASEDTAIAVKPGFVFPQYPIGRWVGKKFIFLPLPKYKQSNGYELDVLHYLPYKTHLGKIATVTKVKPGHGLTDAEVTFHIDQPKEDFTMEMFENTAKNMAFLDDLDSAKKRWVGKTIWLLGNKIFTYNPETDQTTNIKVKKFSAVKVEKIIAGVETDRPVRFIVSDSSGNQGFLDLNLSGTNVYPTLQNSYHFSQCFLEQDPHQLYNWNPEIWEAIGENRISIGMTTKQVVLSIGEPKDIHYSPVNLHSEQWIYYDGKYLTFDNDKLTYVAN